eukprot:7391352-Prymnesium_polylepis.1
MVYRLKPPCGRRGRLPGSETRLCAFTIVDQLGRVEGWSRGEGRNGVSERSPEYVRAPHQPVATRWPDIARHANCNSTPHAPYTSSIIGTFPGLSE